MARPEKPPSAQDGSGGDIPPPEPFAVALRAYVPFKKGRPRGDRSRDRPSNWDLIFDCETTTDPSQRLRFGVYQVRKNGELYRDHEGPEHGIFYVDDDPEAISEHDLDQLERYRSTHGLKLMTVDAFVENIFFLVGYDFRGTIIGQNLPFDISRLAIDHESAHATTYTPKSTPENPSPEKVTNRTMSGAFTLEFRTSYPLGVRVKHVTSKDALINFVGRAGKFKEDIENGVKGWRSKRTGFFVDVKTLAAALLGLEGDLSLESIAKELKTPHQKLGTEAHGLPLTQEYIEYGVQDVQVTWECYDALRARFDRLHLTQTRLHAIHTEASIGKAYQREMGVKPWTQVQPDFPPDIIGHIMSAYFGGRSEVHIRRQETLVLYYDLRSTYPTGCTLMGLWRWVISQGVDHHYDKEGVQAFLAHVTLDDLQNPETWPQLTALVRINLNAEIVPVRAPYGESGSYRLGVNYASSDGPHWFTLADCIASKLLTGRPPEVVDAIRFTPRAMQDGLKPINIMGKDDYFIDPSKHDFYAWLIDLRSEVRGRKAATKEEAVSLHLEQLALKKIANATSYGIFIEMIVDSLPKKEKAVRYGFEDDPAQIEINKGERTGEYFHPLLGVLTTSTARLMLAIAERRACDEGLDWAFCDTDSMAIAKPAEMTEDEFVARASRLQEWFTPLNPYTEKGPLLRLEDDNFALKDGKPTKQLEPLYAYAISAKRYALFNKDSHGRPIIRKALAHGLGHLKRPVENPKPTRGIPEPALDLAKIGVTRWQYDFWYRILESALFGDPNVVKCSDIPGFTHPAASQYAATTPQLLNKWFRKHNANLSYARQVRPFNFLLSFQPRPRSPIIALEDEKPLSKRAVKKALLELPRPIAPFDKDPTKAADKSFDRLTGEPMSPSDLKTYAETLSDYHIHPESKFLNGDYFDRGPTRRRHVFISTRHVQHIGKEADRLEERVYLFEDPEGVIDYGKSQFATRDNLAALKQARREFTATAIAQASGKSRKEVTRILAGTVTATKRTWSALARGIAILRRTIASSPTVR
jgi:hypothetical protein